MLNTRRNLIPAVLALLMGTHSALAQSARTHPSPAPFVATEWGTPMDSVVASAERSGWAFQKVDDDSDLVFLGRVNSAEAVVFATLGKAGGLTRVTISIAPHPTSKETYRELTDTLRARYGLASLGDQDPADTPAQTLYSAAAWPGILMGLRRDGWITIVFTCPESSPRLPVRRAQMPIA